MLRIPIALLFLVATVVVVYVPNDSGSTLKRQFCHQNQLCKQPTSTLARASKCNQKAKQPTDESS